METKI
jgi:hypothetical protein